MFKQKFDCLNSLIKRLNSGYIPNGWETFKSINYDVNNIAKLIREKTIYNLVQSKMEVVGDIGEISITLDLGIMSFKELTKLINEGKIIIGKKYKISNSDLEISEINKISLNKNLVVRYRLLNIEKYFNCTVVFTEALDADGFINYVNNADYLQIKEHYIRVKFIKEAKELIDDIKARLNLKYRIKKWEQFGDMGDYISFRIEVEELSIENLIATNNFKDKISKIIIGVLSNEVNNCILDSLEISIPITDVENIDGIMGSLLPPKVNYSINDSYVVVKFDWK